MIAALRDDVVAVTDAVSAGLATVVDALAAGAETTAQIRTTVATLTGAAADVRAIRADLDTLDVEAEQLYDDAAVTLALWTWERGVRWSLTSLDASIRTTLPIADELLRGRSELQHVVRAGETLQSIAARYLGDWREWPRLAAHNSVDPAGVATGTVLLIPSRA